MQIYGGWWAFLSDDSRTHGRFDNQSMHWLQRVLIQGANTWKEAFQPVSCVVVSMIRLWSQKKNVNVQKQVEILTFCERWQNSKILLGTVKAEMEVREDMWEVFLRAPAPEARQFACLCWSNESGLRSWTCPKTGTRHCSTCEVVPTASLTYRGRSILAYEAWLTSWSLVVVRSSSVKKINWHQVSRWSGLCLYPGTRVKLRLSAPSLWLFVILRAKTLKQA